MIVGSPSPLSQLAWSGLGIVSKWGTGSMVNLYNAEATFPNALGRKDFRQSSKPCHFGIHCITLVEYSQMITHVPGFQSLFRFLHHFVLAKLATSSSIRVKLVAFAFIRSFSQRSIHCSSRTLAEISFILLLHISDFHHLYFDLPARQPGKPLSIEHITETVMTHIFRQVSSDRNDIFISITTLKSPTCAKIIK